jgi:hypothetical protein
MDIEICTCHCRTETLFACTLGAAFSCTKHYQIDKVSGFDLLNPMPPPSPLVPKLKLREIFDKINGTHEKVRKELKVTCARRLQEIEGTFEPVQGTDRVAAVQEHIEVLERSQHGHTAARGNTAMHGAY